VQGAGRGIGEVATAPAWASGSVLAERGRVGALPWTEEWLVSEKKKIAGDSPEREEGRLDVRSNGTKMGCLKSKFGRWEVGRDRRTGGSDAGSTSLLSALYHVSSGLSVLAVGGLVAEVRTGQNKAKKKAHSLGEGTAREDDASGSMAMGTGTAAREGGGVVPGDCDWDGFFWGEGGGL